LGSGHKKTPEISGLTSGVVNPGGTYFFFAVFFAGFFAAFFVAKTLTSLRTFRVDVNYFCP
jgi:hypothetical protein